MNQPIGYFTTEHAVSMTLRDYFAAKALLSPQAPTISLMTLAEGRNVIDPWPCEWAYKVADAMLKARKA